MTCDKCNGELKEITRPDTPHNAELRCKDCDSFMGWKPKEENEDVSRRGAKKTVKDVADFHNQNEQRCFFCRRNEQELNRNESLEVDHIHEIEDGGTDEIENMQILCKACHQLKHHQHLYHNKHRYEEARL